MQKCIDEQLLLNNYYNLKNKKQQKAMTLISCNIVSNRIKELLSSSEFELTEHFLKEIHNYLFRGVYPNSDQYRDYNITKKEFILNGESVNYTNYKNIESCLINILNAESKVKHKSQNLSLIPEHIATFNSNIWQNHPFNDGNTRTTEVFIVKYLRTLGFEITNSLYKENAFYFRNALVRNNYCNQQLGIDSDSSYLIKFYENLLLGTNHKLKSKELIVKKLYKTK